MRLLSGAAAALIALAALCAPPAAAQSNFNLSRDFVGVATFIRFAPTYVDTRVLAANVSETHTLPSGARIVIFSADCNFYAKPGASAAVPAADVTDGSGSEQNPAAWDVTGQTQITLIAATACKVSMAVYK